MSVEATVEERFARLERSNKRLKAGVLAFGTLLTAVVIIGAAAPTPAPKTLVATRFLLVDATGKTRAELSANDKSTALQLLNLDGSRAWVLAAGSSGNGLILSDTSGKTRANLIASGDGTANFAMMKEGSPHEAFYVTDNPQGTALAIRDPNGTDRIDLGYSAKGASLAVADGNGTVRAMVAEEGDVTFKQGGQIDWASFGENLTPEERKHVMDLINQTTPPQ